MQGTIRQESVFEQREVASPPSSSFDMSHEHKLSVQLGGLYPFCTLECLPNDRWSIGAEVNTRFAPLYQPLMHSMSMSMWWFYIPNRILWNQWTEFLTDPGSGKLHPYITHQWNPTTGASQSNIASFMGFPQPMDGDVVDGGTPTLWDMDINAFPIAAYHRIYYDFFINPKLQDYVEVVLGQGDNTSQTWLNYNVFTRNFPKDLFTGALAQPQEGTAVQIPQASLLPHPVGSATSIKGPFSWINASTDVADTTNTLTHSVSGGPYSGDYSTKLTGSDHYLDTQTHAATIRQLTFAKVMQAFLEKLNRAGERYPDYMIAVHGNDPLHGTINFAEFIGSSMGQIQITDVMSTAETEITAGVQPVGAYAGKATLIHGTGSLNFRTEEHGHIIGIVNVQPVADYMQYIEQMWERNDVYDYPLADFAGIGDEELKSRNFVVRHDENVDSDNNIATWGYVPRYSAWRYKNSLISGQFRNDEYQDWHFTRTFDQTSIPALTDTSFPWAANLRILDIFQVSAPAPHVCYMHIWNVCHVQRQLPKYGIPTD